MEVVTGEAEDFSGKWSSLISLKEDNLREELKQRLIRHLNSLEAESRQFC
jgi:hypothetical protein